MINNLQIWQKQIDEVIDRALAEDLGWGDITTAILVSPQLRGRASLTAKAPGNIAGIEIAERVFHRVDPSLLFQPLVSDGAGVKPKDLIATVEGKVASILQAERVALNFLQHLSGIASKTARYVAAVKGLPVFIADTRKTIPGMRLLEKYAVRVGGGRNHRMHLGDGILIKDNHLIALRTQGKSLKESLAEIRQKAPHTLKIEVEAKTLEEVREAVAAGADIVMLDNMSREEMRQAVALLQGKALIEASGGITLEKVREVAETGVNFISIGAITHSAKALDISLELEPIAPTRLKEENIPSTESIKAPALTEKDSRGQAPEPALGVSQRGEAPLSNLSPSPSQGEGDKEGEVDLWKQQVQSLLEKRRRETELKAKYNRVEIRLSRLKSVSPPPMELDLHGFTVDEALWKLDHYLYQAYAAGLSSVRIVHGKGTGALRQAIREQLPKHPLVKAFRPATQEQGGSGATVIELID